eukprot:746230-Amphidinium_carterae.1
MNRKASNLAVIQVNITLSISNLQAKGKNQSKGSSSQHKGNDKGKSEQVTHQVSAGGKVRHTHDGPDSHSAISKRRTVVARSSVRVMSRSVDRNGHSCMTQAAV